MFLNFASCNRCDEKLAIPLEARDKKDITSGWQSKNARIHNGKSNSPYIVTALPIVPSKGDNGP